MLTFKIADWKDVESFTWEEYLQQQKCQAVAARAFKLVEIIVTLDSSIKVASSFNIDFI